jgi:hypothetical protein
VCVSTAKRVNVKAGATFTNAALVRSTLEMALYTGGKNFVYCHLRQQTRACDALINGLRRLACRLYCAGARVLFANIFDHDQYQQTYSAYFGTFHLLKQVYRDVVMKREQDDHQPNAVLMSPKYLEHYEAIAVHERHSIPYELISNKDERRMRKL